MTAIPTTVTFAATRMILELDQNTGNRPCGRSITLQFQIELIRSSTTTASFPDAQLGALLRDPVLKHHRRQPEFRSCANRSFPDAHGASGKDNHEISPRCTKWRPVHGFPDQSSAATLSKNE